MSNPIYKPLSLTTMRAVLITACSLSYKQDTNRLLHSRKQHGFTTRMVTNPNTCHEKITVFHHIELNVSSADASSGKQNNKDFLKVRNVGKIRYTDLTMYLFVNTEHIVFILLVAFCCLYCRYCCSGKNVVTHWTKEKQILQHSQCESFPVQRPSHLKMS